MRKNKRIRILLITSIALTLISAIITYFNVQEKKESTALVIHTYEVIQSSSDLLTLIQNLETGQRGYLLTGDSTFLSPYQEALTAIDADVQHLKEIVSYNPSQTRILNQHLLPLVEEKKQNLAISLDILKKYGNDSATHFVTMRKGKSLTDSIHHWVNVFTEHEEGLLLERNKNLEEDYFISNIIHFSSFALIGLTSIIAFFTIRNKERVNNRLLVHLKELNRNLEGKVKERTHQLEEEKDRTDQLNSELQNNLEEIKLLHDALLEANKRLIQLNEEKDHFLGITTHDLKTPLAGISGLLQLLSLDNENLKANQREYVVLMQDTCAKMQRLVNDLLDINRIEQGVTVIKKTSISVSEVILSMQRQFHALAEDKQISLQFKNEFTRDLINTDADILQRILDNLISNALKFSSAGKSVRIETVEKNTELFIKVMDEGPGITKEEIPLLFGKFQKLAARPTAGESSTGLGLSIVKELVQLLEGTIRVESTPGKGTAFIVIFPL
ncbi:MAG: hypothetical protein DI538_24100 [Azospira oryzae]|nr:MAG: hypothetical protein DI538_24100 [Azospira oryzae]